MENQIKNKEELEKELQELNKKFNSIQVLNTKLEKQLIEANKKLELQNNKGEKHSKQLSISSNNKDFIELENRYQTLFENMTSGFILYEVVLNKKGVPVDLIIIAANKKLEQTIGLKINDVIGKRLKQVLPGIENDEADWIGMYGQVALTGIPKQFRQGSELLGIYLSVSAFQVGTNQCAVTFEDITEIKKAEDLLINEKERINTILNLVGDPIFVKDNQHRLTYANKAFYDIFCLDAKNVIGKTLAESVPEDEKEHFLKVDREVLDTGIPNVCEEKLTVGGKIGTILTKKIRFIDKFDNKFLVGSIHDITARKEAEQVIKKSEERLRDLVNSTDGIVWEADAETFNFTFVSEKAEKILGYPIADWYQDGFWANHIYKEDREKTIEFCIDHTKQKLNHDFEYRFISKSGKIIWMRDIVLVVIKDHDAMLLRGLMIDITHIKEAQEELEIYRTHLEDLVKERTKELAEKNEKLNKMNTLFVGRELRMKELKEEIEKLKTIS